ncbi:MAG: carbohydrate kinase family protein [Lachnospiraceae bacterium]
MKKVAGFGIANVDFIFGNAPRMPRLGEEIYSGSYSKQLGGGSIATLILLSKLGIPSKLATYMGKGPLSQFLDEELKKNKLNYTNLLSTDEHDPVTVSSVVSCEQDRGIISYRPNEAAFFVEKSKVYDFYKGSRIAFLSLEQRALCKPLKELGSMIVLDSAWDDNMNLDWYRDVFPFVDYFIPNEMEAKKITGANTAEKALDILDQYLETPIVKKGSEGCLYKKHGDITIIPSIAAKHKDSTGAGDAFAAGFMYGLYHGYEIDSCIWFGNIMGGNAVTKIGCLAADIDEKRLLEKYHESFKIYSH